MVVEFSRNVPGRIKEKAINALTDIDMSRWKKLSGLKELYSYRLDMNYRIILSLNGKAKVSDHDKYEKKIKIIKRRK